MLVVHVLAVETNNMYMHIVDMIVNNIQGFTVCVDVVQQQWAKIVSVAIQAADSKTSVKLAAHVSAILRKLY